MAPDQPSPESPPLTEVEQLLVVAADGRDAPEASGRFVEALLGSAVGVPGTAEQDGGFTPLVVTYEEQGRRALAFTHPARYQRWSQAVPWSTDAPEVRSIPARELMEQLVRANLALVLNPLNGYGKEFFVAEMSDLLVGVAPGARERVVRERTRLEVGQPSYVPEGLTERLTAYFDDLGGVRRATLAWVRYEDGLEGYFLGVTSDRPREEVVAGIDAPIGDLRGRTLDVLIGAPGEQLVTSELPAFYER